MDACAYLIAKCLTTTLLSQYGGINYLFVYFWGGSGGAQGLCAHCVRSTIQLQPQPSILFLF